MADKITWNDKVSLVTDPTIAEINKVTDDNMNQIKSVTNTNADQLDETIVYDENDITTNTKVLIKQGNYRYINSEIAIGSTNPYNQRTWFKQNTKNLLNFNTINATITNTGDYTYSNARLTFDYIPMEADKQIIFSCNTTTSFMGIAYYNSNKQYISRDTNNSQSNISVTTPANTKYVRPFINIADNIPINNSSINQYEMQLEYGNIRTTFEALINPSIIIDDREIYSKEQWESVNYTDYISFNNSVTTINSCSAIKKGNQVIINYDIVISLIDGTNAIGNVLKKLLVTSWSSGRYGNSSTGVNNPATIQAISNGAINLYTSSTGSRSAGQIILYLD